MMTDKEINEMIRTSALAIHMKEEIAKIMEKYDFDDDGTITEKENDPKSNNKKMKETNAKKTTYRIDFFYTNGGHTSSHVFSSSDNEAIDAALRNAQTRNVVCGDVCGITVRKCTGEHDSSGHSILKTVYEKGKTERF